VSRAAGADAVSGPAIEYRGAGEHGAGVTDKDHRPAAEERPGTLMASLGAIACWAALYKARLRPRQRSRPAYARAANQ
jgi:hypothetical protein